MLVEVFTSRRQFLASAAAVAAPARPIQIIDTHTHFYDPGRPQGVPWPPKNDPVLYRAVFPKEYVELTRPHGIAATIVVEASPWLEDNQWILDLAKDNPVIAGFVGNLNPSAPEFAENLARFAKNPLFRGIRIVGATLAREISREGFLDHARRLAGMDLELDLNGGPSMFSDIVRLCDAAPALRIVINHLPYDWPAAEPARGAAQAALKELGRRPNVYAKVSGVLRRFEGRVPRELNFYRAALDELWGIFGADRVIYGSNWPVSDKIAPYDAVIGVVREYFEAKGAEAMEKYFRRNSMAAYRWRPASG